MESIRRLMVLVLLLIPASLSGQESQYGSESFPMNAGTAVVVEGLVFDATHAIRIIDITDVASGQTVRGAAGGPIVSTLRDGSPPTLCFKITNVRGNAPENILGQAYCYLNDSDADTFIMVNRLGIAVGPLLFRILRIEPIRRS